MSSITYDKLAVYEKLFSNLGVHYFDLVLIKSLRSTQLNPTSVKRYKVLFTYHMSRTLNLELAHDMSTDTFLLALHRVSSRRAFAKVLRSSNGLDFIGVERTLKKH